LAFLFSLAGFRKRIKSVNIIARIWDEMEKQARKKYNTNHLHNFFSFLSNFILFPFDLRFVDSFFFILRFFPRSGCKFAYSMALCKRENKRIGNYRENMKRTIEVISIVTKKNIIYGPRLRGH